MVLETAQLLCTAHHILGETSGADLSQIPYVSTHKNHPSAIWVRSSEEAYRWTYAHMLALGNEYSLRYNKHHLTILKCAVPLKNPPANIPKVPFTEPPQCMPDIYKDSSSSIKGYWNYYIEDKKKICNLEKETLYTSIPLGINY